MPTTIRIAVANNHEIFRKAISDSLAYESAFNVVFQAENGVNLLFELEKNQVDVVILDLQMPVMSGKDVLMIMKDKYPETKVLILSMYDEDLVVIDTIQKITHTYLPKSCRVEELIDAIYSVVNNRSGSSEKLPPELIERTTKTRNIKWSKKNTYLSGRELDILRLICEEKCSREIAHYLHISERTVENHRYKISKKIGTSHGIGMLVYALQNGLAKITADGKVHFD